MAAPSIRPTRVEIDLDAARDNARRIAELAGVDLFAVVKADAYGHGAARVAGALEGQAGVHGFAVSLVEEGSQLRDAGITAPILVMGPALEGGYDEMVGRQMRAMVSTDRDLAELSAIGRRRGEPVPVHLKVDTGMGRLGLRDVGLAERVRELRQRGGLSITGVATHLACAETDDPDDPESMTNRQLARLDAAIEQVRAGGADPVVIHAANSAGAIRFPGSRHGRIRSGIAVYGNGIQPAAPLRQAMRLVTEVVQLRDVPAGSTVSYGALWRAPRPSRVAILPLGYADGVTRRLSNKADVLIRGQRCPVVGAISMDITVADVTALGDAARVGDEAVLLGAQPGADGDAEIRTAELADKAGLLEYEITCAISKRVPRVYR